MNFSNTKIWQKLKTANSEDSSSDSDSKEWRSQIQNENSDSSERVHHLYKWSYQKIIEDREEAEGQEADDDSEKPEVQAEDGAHEEVKNESDAISIKEETKTENPVEDADKHVDGDCDSIEGDDDSIDDQRLKHRKTGRTKRNRKRPSRNNYPRHLDEEESEESEESVKAYPGQICEETLPALNLDDVSPSVKKCVPYRGFWKKTKENFEMGFSNIWDRLKTGSKGLKNRLKGDWSRKNRSKSGLFNDNTNNCEDENEEESSVTKTK